MLVRRSSRIQRRRNSVVASKRTMRLFFTPVFVRLRSKRLPHLHVRSFLNQLYARCHAAAARRKASKFAGHEVRDKRGISLLCSLLSLRAGPEYGRLSVRGSVSGRVSCCTGAHDAGLSIGFASHRRPPGNNGGGLCGQPLPFLRIGKVIVTSVAVF